MKIVQLVKSQDTLTGERNAEPIVGATIKVVDILIGSDQMKKAQKKLTFSKIDFLSSVIIIGLD